MSYFIHVCSDPETNENCLLFSKQYPDGSSSEIEAQIYFTHPAIKLQGAELQVTAFPISRGEIEIVLNRAQERHPVTSRYTNLFSHGKVDKGAPFKISNYPSVASIQELLQLIGIAELPDNQQYFTRYANPDKNHILDGKRRISWNSPIPATPRDDIRAELWSANERREINLINKLNIVTLLINKLPKEDNGTTELVKEYRAFMKLVNDSSVTLATLKEEISRDNSSETIRAFKDAKNEYFTDLEEGLANLKQQLKKHPKLAGDPLLIQFDANVIPQESERNSAMPTNKRK